MSWGGDGGLSHASAARQELQHPFSATGGACSNMETHRVIRTSLTEEFHMLGPCANWLLPPWWLYRASINISPLLQKRREKGHKVPRAKEEADSCCSLNQCFLFTQKYSVHYSWTDLEWECPGKVLFCCLWTTCLASSTLVISSVKWEYNKINFIGFNTFTLVKHCFR